MGVTRKGTARTASVTGGGIGIRGSSGVMGIRGTGVTRRRVIGVRWVRVTVSMGVTRRAAQRRIVGAITTGIGIRVRTGVMGVGSIIATTRRRDTGV